MSRYRVPRGGSIDPCVGSPNFGGFENFPRVEYTLQSAPNGGPGYFGLAYRSPIGGNVSQSESGAKYLSAPHTAFGIPQMLVTLKVARLNNDVVPGFYQWNCLKDNGWSLRGDIKLSEERPQNMGYVRTVLNDQYGLASYNNGRFEVPLITTSPGWIFTGFYYEYNFRIDIVFSGNPPANVDRWGLTLGNDELYNPTENFAGTGGPGGGPDGYCPPSGYYKTLGRVYHVGWPDGPRQDLYEYGCPRDGLAEFRSGKWKGGSTRREWQLFTKPFRPGRFDLLEVPNPFRTPPPRRLPRRSGGSSRGSGGSPSRGGY